MKVLNGRHFEIEILILMKNKEKNYSQAGNRTPAAAVRARNPNH